MIIDLRIYPLDKIIYHPIIDLVLLHDSIDMISLSGTLVMYMSRYNSHNMRNLLSEDRLDEEDEVSNVTLEAKV